MCPSFVEIRSVTSEIKRRKKETKIKKETTAVNYKPFGIEMPCRLIIIIVDLTQYAWPTHFQFPSPQGNHSRDFT